MSRQLSVASAFSVLALAAVALFAPGAADIPHARSAGTTIEFAAPAFVVSVPLID